MLEYRTAIDLEYGAGHPFHDTMPSLTPSPGSTPDPVTAQGVWDEATGEAILTWDASTNPNLSSYSIRVTPGSTYDSASATVAGSVPAGTEEFRTIESLTNPGDTASFKVYVILSTGNTVGSNTVVVTRP